MFFYGEKMKLKIRTYFEDEQNDSFLGIGVLWLLEGIGKHGSIRKAAEVMGMSYSKAHQILKKLENTLGFPMLERHRGGNDRTGARLTEKGEKYLEKYRVFHRRIEEYCNNEFDLFRKEIEKEFF